MTKARLTRRSPRASSSRPPSCSSACASGTPIDLTDAERAKREALRTEYDALEAEYAKADELPDEVNRRLGEIEEALQALESRPMLFDPAEIARAGVFISIDRAAELIVERGYVRPEDETPVPADSDGSGTDVAAEAQQTTDDSSLRGTTITIGHHPRVRILDRG